MTFIVTIFFIAVLKAWNVYIKSKCIQKYTNKIIADKAKGE